MAAAAKAPSGMTIWNAMREELLMNLYQLPYTTLPPTIFHVYLHPADFDRIEGIVPRIVSELQKALTEEVRKINQGRDPSGGDALAPDRAAKKPHRSRCRQAAGKSTSTPTGTTVSSRASSASSRCCRCRRRSSSAGRRRRGS